MLGNALVSTAERGLLREGHSLWGKLQWERELLATMPIQIVLLGIHRAGVKDTVVLGQDPPCFSK